MHTAKRLRLRRGDWKVRRRGGLNVLRRWGLNVLRRGGLNVLRRDGLNDLRRDGVNPHRRAPFYPRKYDKHDSCILFNGLLHTQRPPYHSIALYSTRQVPPRRPNPPRL